jgi:hypothetical protein
LPAESFVPVPVIPGSPELVTKGFFWKPFTNVILRVCYIDMQKTSKRITDFHDSSMASDDAGCVYLRFPVCRTGDAVFFLQDPPQGGLADRAADCRLPLIISR